MAPMRSRAQSSGAVVRRRRRISQPRWPPTRRRRTLSPKRARKEVGAPTRLAAGLVLHEPDGRYTPAAEAILRDGVGLML